MNFKKFAIIAASFLGLIFIAMIVLACIHVNDGLEISKPDTYNVYINSRTATGGYTENDTPKVYSKIDKLYKEMTNLNLVDYMAKGMSFKSVKPGQNLEKGDEFDESVKESGICLELVYEEKQTIVVEIDGNTKVIEFYSIIMQVENQRKCREISVYFSTSSGSYKTYQENAILIVGKQSKLYNYLSSLKVSND